MRSKPLKMSVIVFTFLLLFAGTASAAWSGTVQLTNGAPDNSRWLDNAFDSNGNLHMAYNVKTEPLTPMELWYMKLDNNGNKLVSEKQFTVSDGEWSRCAVVATDSSDNVHVVFCDKRVGNWEPYYVKLDNNGNLLTSDIRLGFSGQDTYPDTSPWPTLAIDSNDYVHVVWTDSPPDNTTEQQRDLYYAKLDNNGNIVVSAKRRTSTASHTINSALAIDSNNNVHITWRDDKDGNYEIYYTKLDNSGTTMVLPRRMTTAAGDALVHPWIVVDSGNNVGIVWPDDRTGNGDIYYMKLDNNGNKLTGDILLASDAAVASSSSDPFTSTPIDSDDNIHIAWAEDRSGIGDQIYYMKIDIDGNILVNDTQLTSTSSDKGRGVHTAIDLNDYPHITWTGDGVGNDEIYYIRELPETHNISLISGWNLISIPLEQSNWSLTSVLAPIEGKYNVVFAFIDGGWKRSTAPRSPLAEMSLEYGYWINMSEPATLPISGTVPFVTTMNVIKGWNLMGFPSLTAQNLTIVLSPISYTVVFEFRDGGWKRSNAPRSPLTHMSPGYGYWINATGAGSYEVRN